MRISLSGEKHMVNNNDYYNNNSKNNKEYINMSNNHTLQKTCKNHGIKSDKYVDLSWKNIVQ